MIWPSLSPCTVINPILLTYLVRFGIKKNLPLNLILNTSKTRCQKSLNILKVLSRTEWGADQTTLLKLYRSLVRSKLDYGCIVHGSASKTALAKLDPVHNQGLRLSLGAFRSSPVESLYVEAHEPPLEIRREKLALLYILKLKANPGNPAYDVVFNPKYHILYADKESATDSFGIHCKKLLKKAKIDVGEIAINSIPDIPIWDSEPVTVDFTLSEFDKSSTSSTVFKSRFNEVKQKYLDFCHIYTDGSKVETKVASAYVCPYGTRGYRLRDGCSVFTTRLTHSFRMENRPHPPLCDQCEGDHELTVKHILIECNFLKIIRRRYYDVTDLNRLFKTVSPKRILDFVKDILSRPL